LALSSCEGEFDFQQGLFDGLLRCQGLLDYRENAGGFFWTVSGQVCACRTEQVLVAIGSAVLPGQRLVHACSAHLVALTRERISVVKRRRRFSAGTEARTARQGDCGRGDHNEANDPSR
jgi:hypothetical protein